MASVKDLETGQLIAVVGVGLWLAGEWTGSWPPQAIAVVCWVYAALATFRWGFGRIFGGGSEVSRLRRRIENYNRANLRRFDD